MKLFAVACLLACASLSACGSGDGTGSAASTDNSSSTGELAYFVPTVLPDGYKITETDVQDEGEAEPATWVANVGRRDGDNRFTALTLVLVNKSGPADDSDDSGYEPVDINGHAGKKSDSIAGSIVMWKQDGLDIGVVGPPGTLNDAVAIARAVRPSSAIKESGIEGLPSGLEVIAQWGSDGYPRRRYTINAETTDANGTIDSLRISVTLVPSDFPAVLLGAGHRVDSSGKVRSRQSHEFVASTDIGPKKLEQFTVSWAERSDLVVTVAGTVGLEGLRSVAEGLKEEPESSWRAKVKAR